MLAVSMRPAIFTQRTPVKGVLSRVGAPVCSFDELGLRTWFAGEFHPRIGLVINDIPTVESKAPSQFGGVLLASARHAPLAPDKGYNTHDTLSLVYTAA